MRPWNLIDLLQIEIQIAKDKSTIQHQGHDRAIHIRDEKINHSHLQEIEDSSEQLKIWKNECQTEESLQDLCKQSIQSLKRTWHRSFSVFCSFPRHWLIL